MRAKTATWFEVGIRYRKMQGDGAEKVVTEKYAVDAVSFTEAESVINEMMSACINGDFTIKSEVQANYGEVFFSDREEDDRWYKAKIAFITLDEKSGKEKRINANYLVQGQSMQKALNNIGEIMSSLLVDYNIVGLTETKVLDVFEHQIKLTGKGA